MSSSTEEKLNLILIRLDDIDKRISKIESSCSNMDDHISFIGKVYNYFSEYLIMLPLYGKLIE